MKREIVLDTETTGLDPNAGHRIVEIGCVELINLVPSGRTYHQYINPERDMPQEAFNVHGLSQEFLSQHPTFKEIVKDFLDFISDDAVLVIHNASFDMKFIDWELAQLTLPTVPRERVVDSLAMARKKHPGARNSLDALCKRYDINNSHRQYHGALLDSELLAEVYLHLCGGKQPGFDLQAIKKQETSEGSTMIEKLEMEYRQFLPSNEEIERHAELISKLKNAKWHLYS